jgi:hypothetical protein
MVFANCTVLRTRSTRALYSLFIPIYASKLLFLDPTFVKKRCVVRPVHPIFCYISSLWTRGLTHISPSRFSTHFPTMSSTAVRAPVPNGIPKPDLDLPVGHCSRFPVNSRILRCPFSTQTGQRLSRTIYSSLQSLRQTRAYICSTSRSISVH